VESVEGELLAEEQIPGSHVYVEVWTNGEAEPDDMLVLSTDRSADMRPRAARVRPKR
jgi:hypothetical protein